MQQKYLNNTKKYRKKSQKYKGKLKMINKIR